MTSQFAMETIKHFVERGCNRIETLEELEEQGSLLLEEVASILESRREEIDNEFA